MKAIILKPVVWNSENYTKPSGHKATSGFAQKYGYGHEEWNNSRKNIWRNQRVFHSESPDKLLNYSKTGELGIILIASFDKVQYALGIATNVYHNSKVEMKLIAEELNVFGRHLDLWEINTVKNSFNQNKKEFLKHWEKQHEWIRWRCPQENYHWFENPIPLNPKELTGKEKVISMHGSYQTITPYMAIEIIHKYLPHENESYKWLTEGEFDEKLLINIPNNKKKSAQTLRKEYKIKKGNKTSQDMFEYWVEGKRTVNPLHTILQAKYVAFLKKSNYKPIEDKNYIDIQYEKKGILYLSEIKPTDTVKIKYAIRAAIGQILEYAYESKKKVELEIVIGSKPTKNEIKFVNSLGITLTYESGEGFTVCTPKAHNNRMH